MPGHRDYIVAAIMEIDNVAGSGKGIWGRSGGRVANPEELAKAIEATFKDRPIGRSFILRETRVSAVHPSFNIIAEIARVATESSPRPGGTKRASGSRVTRRRKPS